MLGLFTAELLKLRTTRSFGGLVGLALGLSLLITLLATLVGEDEDVDDVIRFTLVLVSQFFVLVMAIVGTAGEWRHRTIASSLLAAPDRVRFLAAKVAGYAVAGAVLALVVSLLTYGVAFVLAPDLETDGLGGLLVRNLVLGAYFGALGAAWGALVRNQPGAIVGAILVGFFLEPALIAVFEATGDDGGSGHPFGPVFGAPTSFMADAGAPENEGLLDRGVAGLTLAAWVAGTFAAAVLTLRRRDV